MVKSFKALIKIQNYNLDPVIIMLCFRLLLWYRFS